MAIINKTIIAQYVPVAANLDSDRMQLLADEQEAYRCQKLLGKDLYADVKANPTTPENAALINELQPVLVYWTMSSYQLKGSVFNTATGAFHKRTDASIPLSDDKENKLLNEYCNMSRFYESELDAFLKENATDYPLWRGTMRHSGRQRFAIKTTTNTTEI